MGPELRSLSWPRILASFAGWLESPLSFHTFHCYYYWISSNLILAAHGGTQPVPIIMSVFLPWMDGQTDGFLHFLLSTTNFTPSKSTVRAD